MSVDSACAVLVKHLHERTEHVVFDRIADFLHQLQVVMQVVDRVQLRAEDLPHTMQMVQIAAREIAACVAAAAFVEWLE